ncbi:Zinc finger protein [Pseudolycoriella hygida]|uniref:Zinc finger protein n=1 Tax=Pseudolycoriella hygida TaxID=35572 RepID=A0A9Q0NAA6_9DIPT|nr:Zinc finger protein [Pseudolycoriella hygida]
MNPKPKILDEGIPPDVLATVDELEGFGNTPLGGNEIDNLSFDQMVPDLRQPYTNSSFPSHKDEESHYFAYSQHKQVMETSSELQREATIESGVERCLDPLYAFTDSQITDNNAPSTSSCLSQSQSTVEESAAEFRISGTAAVPTTSTMTTEESLHRNVNVGSTSEDSTNRFECPECEMSFGHLSSLKRHILAQHSVNRRSFKCDICGDLFASRKGLEHHLTRCQRGPYKCNVCERDLFNMNRRPKILDERVPEDVLATIDELENEGFGNLHVRGNERDNFSFDQMVPDLRQPYTNFSFWSNWDEELAIERRLNPLYADPYSQITDNNAPSTSSCLSQYQSTVEESAAEFRISETAAVPTTSTMTAEESLHRNVNVGSTSEDSTNRYECPECGNLFTRLSSLKRHILVLHPDARPYECRICNEKFKDHRLLKVHKISHDNRPSFKCDICGSPFMSRNGFEYHQNRCKRGKKAIPSLKNTLDIRYSKIMYRKDWKIIFVPVKNSNVKASY